MCCQYVSNEARAAVCDFAADLFFRYGSNVNLPPPYLLDG